MSDEPEVERTPITFEEGAKRLGANAPEPIPPIANPIARAMLKLDQEQTPKTKNDEWHCRECNKYLAQMQVNANENCAICGHQAIFVDLQLMPEHIGRCVNACAELLEVEKECIALLDKTSCDSMATVYSAFRATRGMNLRWKNLLESMESSVSASGYGVGSNAALSRSIKSLIKSERANTNFESLETGSAERRYAGLVGALERQINFWKSKGSAICRAAASDIKSILAAHATPAPVASKKVGADNEPSVEEFDRVCDNLTQAMNEAKVKEIKSILNEPEGASDD